MSKKDNENNEKDLSIVEKIVDSINKDIIDVIEVVKKIEKK
jgi:hypothetical protein